MSSATVVSRAHVIARARRRRREGGAVIFIVAMTLALMLSMGAYAMQAASTEIRTSGYVRQAAQTHYLTEYGILGTAHEVQASRAELYLRLMTDPVLRDHLPLATDPQNVASGRAGARCPSLLHVPASASNLALACRLIPSAQLAQAWGSLASGPSPTAPFAAVSPYDPARPTNPGSLGPAPVGGDFTAELTEPTVRDPPPGYDLTSSLCFTSFTVSATGVTYPALSSSYNLAIYAGQTVETARARITAGPIRCPR